MSTDCTNDRTERRRSALTAVAKLLARKKTTPDAESIPPKTAFFRGLQGLTDRIKSGQRQGDRMLRDPLEPSQSEEESIAQEFEKTLWDSYGLIGVIVPDELLKECQRRVQISDPGSDLRWETEEELQFLDQLHQYRKEGSMVFAKHHPKGIWENVQKVEPTPSMQSKGKRFWAVIIGNDNYRTSPLSGCVNDAHLVQHSIITYLNVPHNHIRLLQDADRNTIINAFYDLRDSRYVEPGDNILIHFSGHGTSYPTSDYFKTSSARAGSIEAICPIDRDRVPDISERELNSILSEIRRAKGPNITVFLDCCHSGGAVRAFGDTVRFIPPVQRGYPLRDMLQAADRHPRRQRNSPTLTSEFWQADTSSFVLLAACQDFQLAEEFNVPSSNDVSGHFQPKGRGPITAPIKGPKHNRPSLSGWSPLSGWLSSSGQSSLPSQTPLSGQSPLPSYIPWPGQPGFGMITASSPRHGRFTWALIKILESEMGINATYTSVINSIGKLGPMQVPVAVGLRKNSQLWFEE